MVSVWGDIFYMFYQNQYAIMNDENKESQDLLKSKINEIEKLVQSFIFTLVFHKLLIDKVVRFFSPSLPQEPIKYEQ